MVNRKYFNDSKVEQEAINNMASGLNDFMKQFGIEEINIESRAIVKTKGKYAKHTIKKKKSN